MLALLRNRTFALLFVGQSFATFGGLALLLVLGVWGKELTGSNAVAGLIILAFIAPSLAGPFVGFLVDRARRRPFLLGTNVAVALALTPLLVIDADGPVWLLYVVAALYGGLGVLQRAALAGLIQVIVPRAQLGEANSLLQTVRMALRLVAPLIGAGIYAAVGGPAVALLVMGTFVVSVLTLAALRVEEAPPERSELALRAEVTAGLGFVRGHRSLRELLLTLGLALLLIGPIETAYFAVVDEGLGRPPSFLGVLFSLEGVGALVGALTAPRIMRAAGQVTLVGTGMLLLGVGVVTAISSSLVVVLGGSVLFGLGLPWLMIGFGTYLQLHTPRPLMGRVSTTVDLVLGLPNTISVGAGALLIAVVDYRLLLAVAAFGLFACGGWLLSRRTHLAAEPGVGVQPPATPAPAAEAASDTAERLPPLVVADTVAPVVPPAAEIDRAATAAPRGPERD